VCVNKPKEGGGSASAHYTTNMATVKSKKDDKGSGQARASVGSVSGKQFQVQDYQVLQKLGSGSFGDIYLGKHVETGAEVAIKMV
jgi:serine/threonine protein kinase